MANELRFGVIGCGSMARDVHCPNMAAAGGARTMAYCDVQEDRARALLEQFGGEYATADAARVFADRSIDGVLIQIGPAVHPMMVQAAARAGKHVFVEKPLAENMADALDTVRAVEAAGVAFQFGTCNRLAPMVRKAWQMCPHPLYSYCQCADTVTHQAVHNLDLAMHLFHGAPLQTVYASGRQHWGLDPRLPADSFAAVLTFADGTVHNYIQHGGSFNAMLTKYHYQLFGRDCCVYLAKRFKECHLMRSRDKAEFSWGFDGPDFYRGPHGYMGHFEELRELVDCIRGGGRCTMTVRDAARVLAAEKAILHSIETGTAVDFPAFLREHGAGFLLEKETQ
ncbi:MAG TPA: Gfo/Idh/MocA family oxidoreductase [Planctomycetota bacterium]|nr:Gfo/Idh/MocA family oxidoreductase [Planctomycetota bacterium]